MQASTILTTLTLTASLALTGAASAQNGPGAGGVRAGSICHQVLVQHLASLPVGDLDDDEAAAVTFLREEEKLARDVYLTLSLSWEPPVFSRIARSEQRHMDLVALLLDRYGLVDPVGDDVIGRFTNPDLDVLFDELVAAGQQSLVDALAVGATIEDLDLADLEALLSASNDLDVDLIAENLAAGSRNHLRAFVGALADQGADYAPQYLDEQMFTDIITAGSERGVVVDEFGDVLAECGPAGEVGGSGSGGNQTRSGGQGGSGGQTGHGGQNGNGVQAGAGDGTGDCDGTGRG
jgi:hypothetical protein